MNGINYSKGQLNSLVILRILIGWHFLYEGVLKLYNPSWTAKGYLLSSQGFMKSIYYWLGNDSLIGSVDFLNILLLIAIGTALILGIAIRWASVGGITLLMLYYLSHPPFPWLPQGPAEGNYWIVNKNLIEVVALIIVYQFPTSRYFGLEVFTKRYKSSKQTVR